MDEYFAEHAYKSLLHIRFLRDFMRRTGFIEEIETFPYGAEPEGYYGDSLTGCQLREFMPLLEPDMTTDVMWGYEPDVESPVLVLENGEMVEEELDFCAIFTFSLPVKKEHTLMKWWHFIKWGAPYMSLGRFVNSEDDGGECNFCIIVPEPDESQLMDVYYALLGAWEVETYYGNIANAVSWQEIRGTRNDNTRTGKAPENGDCGFGRSGKVQNDRVA